MGIVKIVFLTQLVGVIRRNKILTFASLPNPFAPQTPIDLCHLLRWNNEANKFESSDDNLHKPFYFGDLNVTEGTKFTISCTAERPVKWYKDGEPIEKHFVRHGQEEFSYTARDNAREGPNGKIESTLEVSRAVLRHKGKYQCNINHENAHHLHVHPLPKHIESDGIVETFKSLDSADDHVDQRVRYEIPLEEDKPLATTMMMMMINLPNEVTESSRKPSPDFDSDYDEDKSLEKFVDQQSADNSFSLADYETTSRVLTTMNTPSLTNIPLHPTHATHSNHVAHTTHVIPSEVKTQTHHEQHVHKGSQKWYKKKMIRKSFAFRVSFVLDLNFYLLHCMVQFNWRRLSVEESFRLIFYLLLRADDVERDF